MSSMPHPHIAALAISAERGPWTRSMGCLRMLQLGLNVTAAPFKMKASEVWICNKLARSQKITQASPMSRSGIGLFARREFAATFERALRMLAISDLL